jgi:hypothetical protein
MFIIYHILQTKKSFKHFIYFIYLIKFLILYIPYRVFIIDFHINETINYHLHKSLNISCLIYITSVMDIEITNYFILKQIYFVPFKIYHNIIYNYLKILHFIF